MEKDIASLRVDYSKKSLDVKDVNIDPVEQFISWFNEALDAKVVEPNAMTLSTVNAENRPSGRILLLKGVEDGAFLFFTNYNSRKGQELITNKFAAMTFFWAELERQVRIEGTVEKVSLKKSDDYFKSRPEGSKVGAWVSPQSQVIESRDILEKRKEEFLKQLQDKDIPRPEHWGGFKLIPDKIEFWQGRPSRLHDRILYRKNEHGQWLIERLAP